VLPHVSIRLAAKRRIPMPTSPDLKELLDQLETKIEHDLNQPALHLLSMRLLGLARQQKKPSEQVSAKPSSTATALTAAKPRFWQSRRGGRWI